MQIENSTDTILLTIINDPFDPYGSRVVRTVPYERLRVRGYVEKCAVKVPEEFEVVASIDGRIVDDIDLTIPGRQTPPKRSSFPNPGITRWKSGRSIIRLSLQAHGASQRILWLPKSTICPEPGGFTAIWIRQGQSNYRSKRGTMHWKKWIYGLISATIGGAANSIVAMTIDPEQFNFGDGLDKLLTFASVGAILSAAMFLKQTPLPPAQ